MAKAAKDPTYGVAPGQIRVTNDGLQVRVRLTRFVEDENHGYHVDVKMVVVDSSDQEQPVGTVLWRRASSAAKFKKAQAVAANEVDASPELVGALA